MRFFQGLTGLYHRHETWAKLSGFLAFLVILASLYVFVFSGLKSGGASATPLGTSSPSASGSRTPVGTAFPTLPPLPTATPAPPLLPPRYQVARQTNLFYEPAMAPGERFDLCTPVGAPGPRPGVILLHDIGPQLGDKSNYYNLCTLLASQGFVAAAINFRSYPAVWPAELEDAQLAVRWLRAHASQYKLDPARLCALGNAAGGYLSIFLGALATIYPGDKATLLSDQSPHVSCIVDEFGMSDLTTLDQSSFWQSAFTILFGVNAVDNQPGLLHQASPIFYVSARTAPTLIVQGTLDDIVPPSQSKELQRALQQDGVPVSYITYPGGHNFTELPPQQFNALEIQIINYLSAQEQP